MAYEKTTWATGDVITAQKLNKVENHIAGLVAPAQSVTITAQDTDGVEITLADGYVLPADLRTNWIVTIDGNVADDYSAEYKDYLYFDETTAYYVSVGNGAVTLKTQDVKNNDIVPGTYTVSIFENTNAPMVVGVVESEGGMYLDKTYTEIRSAALQGRRVVCFEYLTAGSSASGGEGFYCAALNGCWYWWDGSRYTYHVNFVKYSVSKSDLPDTEWATKPEETSGVLYIVD